MRGRGKKLFRLTQSQKTTGRYSDRMSTATPAARGPSKCIYTCCQLTRTVHQLVVDHLSDGGDLIMAVPTFNMHCFDKEKMPSFQRAMEETGHAFNIPVYGPVTTEAVVRLITWLNSCHDFRQILGSASFERNTFVIDKATKGITKSFLEDEQLVDSVEGEASKSNVRAAMTRLKDFMAKANAQQPTSVPEWYAFVSSELKTNDWKNEHTLHVQHVLQLFGLTEDESKACAGTRFKIVDGKEDKTQRGERWRALEWLTKMISGGYGPAGATSDVVNLIFALERKERGQSVAEVVDAFRERRLEGNDLSGLRDLPTVMINDGEFDDTLAWKLLYHLHSIQNTLGAFKVFMQVPDFEASDFKDTDDRPFFRTLTTVLHSANVEIVRDAQSKNGKKIVHNPMYSFPGGAGAPTAASATAYTEPADALTESGGRSDGNPCRNCMVS